MKVLVKIWGILQFLCGLFILTNLRWVPAFASGKWFLVPAWYAVILLVGGMMILGGAKTLRKGAFRNLRSDI